MDQKVNPIQPPPSVDDLLALGSEGRLGQVDFANRLVPETRPAKQDDAPLATVTPVRRRSVSAVPALPTEPAPAVEALLDSAPEPAVKPEPEVAPEPETVAEEPVAEEPVVEEPVVEPEPEPAAAKPAPRRRPKPAAKPTAKPTAKAKPAKPARRTTAPKVAPVEPEPVVEPAEVAEVVEPVVPAILPIANLSGDSVSASAAYDDELFAAEVSASPAVASEVVEVTEDEAPTLRVPLERAQSPWRLARQAAPRPVAAQAPDDAYLGSSVQEVADAAIERLRDAENATLQHLRALEAEAARRAELLTAQAELDAELIRITARREAHAIISAARSQAGLSAPSSRDGRQLAEISDAVSRFAESIESSLALQPHANQGDHA